MTALTLQFLRVDLKRAAAGELLFFTLTKDVPIRNSESFSGPIRRLTNSPFSIFELSNVSVFSNLSTFTNPRLSKRYRSPPCPLRIRVPSVDSMGLFSCAVAICYSSVNCSEIRFIYFYVGVALCLAFYSFVLV